MKRILLLALLMLGITTSQAQITPGSPDNFITVWNTLGTTEITIPTTGGGYNYNLYWEEVGNPSNNGNLLNQTGNATISGLATGTDYRVEITGIFPRIIFNNGPQSPKISQITQWGSIQWSSMLAAFSGCSNMNVNATDVPDLTNVSICTAMFQNCSSMTGIGANWNWNTGNVTSMASMFNGASAFNQPIDNWNTGNVNEMYDMFYNASAFNQPIGNWNTENVSNMSYMFRGASAFNQPIGNWNTGNVISMINMFSNANSFNQNIGNWDTGNVIAMYDMFFNASAFNQPIGNWNTGNVTTMGGMFYNASAFNQPIANWNTGNVIYMNHMFQGASSFNQPIGNWNTENVSNMSYMFSNANSFNQPIGNWNTGNVAEMYVVFSGASAFNQNIGDWDLSNVISMPNMFDNSGIDCHNYSQTLIGWAANSNTPNTLGLGANGRQYGTNAVAARDILVNTKGWTIYGDAAGGTDCSSTANLEMNTISQLSIFPNPGSGMITLSVNQPTSAVFTSANGAILANLELNVETSIDVSTYAPGVYFIRTAEGQTVKFIKE